MRERERERESSLDVHGWTYYFFLSICVSALSRLQFLSDFDKTWHRPLEPKMKALV